MQRAAKVKLSITSIPELIYNLKAAKNLKKVPQLLRFLRNSKCRLLTNCAPFASFQDDQRVDPQVEGPR